MEEITSTTNNGTIELSNDDMKEDTTMENNTINTTKATENTPVEEIICEHCGVVLDKNNLDSYEVVDGDYYCKECLAKAEKCHDCDHLLWEDEDDIYYINNTVWNPITHTIESRGFYVCEDCTGEYYQCDDCGEYFANSGDVHNDEEICVCDSCYGCYHYHTCEDCGRIMRQSDAYFCQNDDCYYCENCINEHETNDNGYIHGHWSHDTINDPCFHPDNIPEDKMSTTLFYGCELETTGEDNRWDYAEELHSISKNETLFTMEEDGSIGDEGVEIITQPCTLEYYEHEFPLNEIREIANNYGYVSHNAKRQCCGLHIHASRIAFGATEEERNLTILKCMILMNRFWEPIVKFTRRANDNINSWASLYDVEVLKDKDIASQAADIIHGNNHNRYHAINTQNRTTVEFRIFRGTLNRNTIIASIQFVDQMINYCKTHDLSEVMSCTWYDWLNPDKYEELHSYCEERGLLTDFEGKVFVMTD